MYVLEEVNMSDKNRSGKNSVSGKSRALFVSAVALCVIVVCVVLTLRARSLPASEVPAAYGTILALLPPVIAIALSLITKEVYSSLFVGIVVGAMLYAGGDAEVALSTMLYHESAGLVVNLTDISHASILVFVTLLGTMVVLINQSGGADAFGRWASTHIKNRVGAQLATIFMGLLIFVDDGFNCMTVGSVMRPLTDQHRISRVGCGSQLCSSGRVQYQRIQHVPAYDSLQSVCAGYDRDAVCDRPSAC